MIFGPDGKQILTTYLSNDTLRNWDVNTGRQIGENMIHESSVKSAIFSRDEKWILTVSGDKAFLWNAATGRQLYQSLKHTSVIRSAVFSSDEKNIIAFCDDNSVSKWDAVTGKPIGSLTLHEIDLRSAIFSPNGKLILTSSDMVDLESKQSISTNNTKLVMLWDTESGKQLGTPLFHKNGVTSAVFSPDGKWILTSGRLWRVSIVTRSGVLAKQKAQVYSAAFSPEGERILTTSSNNTARVWSAETAKQIGLTMQHNSRLISASLSPDGKSILTAGGQSVLLWNAATGQQMGETIVHKSLVKSAVFSPDGKWILTACSDNTIRLWSVTTCKQVGRTITHEIRSESFMLDTLSSAIFSPDGKWILSWSSLDVGLWDAAIQKQIDSIGSNIESAAFSPNGKRMLNWFGGRVSIWDLTLHEAYDFNKEIGKPIEQNDTIRSAVFSPDGRRILTANDDGTARLWKIGKREHNWEQPNYDQIGPSMQHTGGVVSAVFSPDGSRILTASSDSTACLWDAKTGKQIGLPMHHNNGVTSAVFSPDGNKVLTVSKDSTVRVWNIIGDIDISSDLFQLQAKVITGVKLDLNVVADAINPIDDFKWEPLKRKYDIEARRHYKECKYPEYNLWRRFNPEEAKKIRTDK